ncbi:helix-turn-helix transcriptional regulator [Roseibium sp.]|uniref:helix-turn-helix transcriptional regulator n=1 Tax=Roseibium sp. TaxID=1936156 RepID=UPI003A9849CB
MPGMIDISAENEFRLLERVQECAGNSSLWPETLRCAQRSLSCAVYLLEIECDGEHTGRFCSFEEADPVIDFLKDVRTEANKTVLDFLVTDAALNYPYCKVHLTRSRQRWDEEPEPEVARWPGLIAPVLRSDDATILLACFWTGVTIDEINPDDVMAPFRRFTKAVSAALEISERSEARDSRYTAMQLMMNNQSGAMCLIDEDLAIQFTTPSCQALFNVGDMFTVNNNRLVPARRDLEIALNSVSRHVTQTRHSDAPRSFANYPPTAEQSVFVPSDGNSLCHVSIRSLKCQPNDVGGDESGFILVEVKTPSRLTEELEPLMQSAFGLSKGEVRLAYDLAASGSLSETLDNLNITRNTAKTHLRRIYEKTATQSQVELIQLMQSLSGLF